MKMSSEGLQVFDTDLHVDYKALIAKSPTGEYAEVKERDRVNYDYCSTQFLQTTGIPGFDQISRGVRPQLLEDDQLADALDYAHEQETLPMYYTYQWRPKGFRYNQNGIGYCWTWSGTGCLMTTRAIESKDLVYLVPVSMGFLVDWKDRGNYLAHYVMGARDYGVLSGTQADLNNHSRNRNDWPMGGERELYQLEATWDLDPRDMIRQCATCLTFGRSIYIAYNWWGHALELVGMRYNSQGVLEWIISNSHNEDDLIILTGSRATPSEAIVFVSSRVREASTMDYEHSLWLAS